MTELSELHRLVRRAHPAPEEAQRGATPTELARLEASLETPLPSEFAAWLEVCGGSTAGPGGLFGVREDIDWLLISTMMADYPTWKEKGWLPVAGDGNGNYFVLDTQSEGRPVGFVEPMEAEDVMQFYAASDLFIFLRELLQNEIESTGWPFDVDYVLKVDPNLQVLSPLPWE